MNSRISKKDKNKINQQEMLNFFNIKINKKLKELNSSSETTRIISFNQWLGGLMDSDGTFYLSKKNYLSCEITLSLRKINSLYKIKSKFGGSIKLRIKSNAFRWRLHKKELLINFLNTINGFIFLKKELYQKVMQIYLPNEKIKNIELKNSGAGLSGFFEGDGYVNLNSSTLQIIISISQKNKNILEDIKKYYGGNIYFDKSWNGYKWEISEKNELINIFEYFTLYPLKSVKNSDLISAKRFFRYKLLKYHLDEKKNIN